MVDSEPGTTIANVNNMIAQLIKAEAEIIPEFTEADIEELRLELGKIVEDTTAYDQDYEKYIAYAYENMPICPYCGAALSYSSGNLFCNMNKCFTLALEVPVTNIADIAWQMKTVNEKHK